MSEDFERQEEAYRRLYASLAESARETYNNNYGRTDCSPTAPGRDYWEKHIKECEDNASGTNTPRDFNRF